MVTVVRPRAKFLVKGDFQSNLCISDKCSLRREGCFASGADSVPEKYTATPTATDAFIHSHFIIKETVSHLHPLLPMDWGDEYTMPAVPKTCLHLAGLVNPPHYKPTKYPLLLTYSQASAEELVGLKTSSQSIIQVTTCSMN